MASPTQPKIKLYWLNNSRAQRFVWLLEELGLSYDIDFFQRDKDMFAPPELRKIHPLGKSPIIGITLPATEPQGEQRELVLAESGFIAQYLTEHLGHTRTLLPKRYRDGQEGQLGGETEQWMRYQYFLHYAEGSLMPPLLVSLLLSILKGSKIPFFIRPITSSVADKLGAAFLVPEMDKQLGFLESQLETSPDGGGYLCGARLTAADILMSFPLQLAKERIAVLGLGRGQGTSMTEKYPRVWAYLQRLEDEPGYKLAEAKVKELEKKASEKASP